MYVSKEKEVTTLQGGQSACSAVGLGVTGPVMVPLRLLKPYAGPMTRPNLVRQRFLAELNAWLDPALLYHCFTGEDDAERLAHVNRLHPALQEPLLAKAELEWPARLQAIAAARRSEQQQSKAMVQQFILRLNSSQP